jgi:hypothetical protein
MIHQVKTYLINIKKAASKLGETPNKVADFGHAHLFQSQ